MFDLSIESDVARLSLGRPEARNAVPVGGWVDLARAAEEAGRRARALILSGEPNGVFCAGADISDFEAFEGDPEARANFRRAIRHGLDALRDLAIPTIALVEGDCYGAGVALGMACDLRLAGPGARFAITPAKFGIGYPQEDVHRLVLLVGPGQAARLLFGAESIDAAEAVRIGLAERLGGAEAAQALAESIARNDPDSLAVLKTSLGLAARGIRQDEEQDRAFDRLLGSDSLRARLAAYRSRKR